MSRSPNAKRLVPVMPPLLEEEKGPLTEKASFSGTSCETIIKSYFLSKGINVAKPYIDEGADILIKKPEGWVTSQVKKVVYKYELDHQHLKNFGGYIYRPYYTFSFQRSSQSKGKQRGPKDNDYFYHVLLTPYRQLIWETPSKLVPLRKDGSFISKKDVALESDAWVRMVPQINFKELLISSQYNPIIFKRYPEFFLKEDKPTVEQFFV
jgi:hypothetical protein